MVPRAKFDLALLPERPNLDFEIKLWGQGLRLVAGVDEAGRGALAGPVAAGPLRPLTAIGGRGPALCQLAPVISSLPLFA